MEPWWNVICRDTVSGYITNSCYSAFLLYFPFPSSLPLPLPLPFSLPLPLPLSLPLPFPLPLLSLSHPHLSIRYGHQDGVSAIDCLHRERPVTAGTNDRSVRVWKVVQESQLVFTGHKWALYSLSGFCLRVRHDNLIHQPMTNIHSGWYLKSCRVVSLEYLILY